MVDRPFWTRRESSFVLWTEDEATIRSSKHETMDKAWRRLYPSSITLPNAMVNWSEGDAVYKLTNSWHVLVESSPGDNEIRIIRDKATPKDLKILQNDNLRICSHQSTCSVCGHFFRPWKGVIIHGASICESCIYLAYYSIKAGQE